MLLHECQRVVMSDKFFVCGGNPANDGGGVIGTRATWNEAVDLKVRAIKENYTLVRILTYAEMFAID